jgi:hypothetical protein
MEPITHEVFKMKIKNRSQKRPHEVTKIRHDDHQGQTTKTNSPRSHKNVPGALLKEWVV